MRRVIRFCFLSVFVLILVSLPIPMASAHLIPDATDYVSDFAGVLTSEERATLDQIVQELKVDTGAELAIVIVEYAMEDGEDFHTIAVEYFNEQGIGQAEWNNGVLVLLATEDREIGIFAGRGLEEALSDDLLTEIIETKAIPHLSRGDEQWGVALIQTVETLDPLIRSVEFTDAGSALSGPGCSILIALFFIALGIGGISTIPGDK